MTTPYTEAGTAEGAWTQSLRLPAATSVEQVHRALAELARSWPVAAFLPGEADEPVGEVVLYRDPSRTYGTPDTSACDAAVRRLVAATGWTPAAGRADDGVLVGLGLREGYGAGAPEHSPEEVADRLRVASAMGWRCRAARLISARFVDDAVRWYAEDGVIVRAEDRLLPAIEEAALSCAQQRYVVTHLAHQRTYVLQQCTSGGLPS
ncbi:hypothetical protein ACFU99_26790 [Streptomyces sp. NPDC057654]|uniref:hypothetical protein n=1 Tax=Streptomyces sp. NPDC057654 TaxID=3346196 RepID=UPI0036B4310E